MKGCIDCGGERDLKRSDRGFRSRCRTCWNNYSRAIQKKHQKYYTAYLKIYQKGYRKINKNYLATNNKSNKKAIFQLKDSYIKNRLKDKNASQELIETKRLIIKIKRLCQQL